MAPGRVVLKLVDRNGRTCITRTIHLAGETSCDIRDEAPAEPLRLLTLFLPVRPVLFEESNHVFDLLRVFDAGENHLGAVNHLLWVS